MRRLAIGLLAAGVALAASALAGGGAAAQTPLPSGPAPVDVFEVNGLVDEPVADGIMAAIAAAETDGAQALVLQIDSTDAVVSSGRMAQLAERIRGAAVAVTIWVGPSGARAYGAPGQLLGAAAVTGMAPGSRIGRFGEPLAVAAGTLEWGAGDPNALESRTVGLDDARALGLLKPGPGGDDTPVLRNFIGALDGLTYNGRTIVTTETITNADGSTAQNIIAQPRFAKLGLLARLMHTVASPPVAYLLITIGLCLLVFEFFTAGVGIAGAVGAGCIVLACYGLIALPTRWWAFGLILAAVLAFAVDVQTGVPRFWTAVGVVTFVAGSVYLFDGMPLSWITLVAGIGGVLLAFLAGMPAMVRTRFATPTIGREWMVGEIGEAVVSVDPDGVVRVHDAQWRARTNRATPIPAGQRVRVVAIDGVTLEVEPEAGGARDYRERAARQYTPHPDQGNFPTVVLP